MEFDGTTQNNKTVKKGDPFDQPIRRERQQCLISGYFMQNFSRFFFLCGELNMNMVGLIALINSHISK
jgi:hypothetical protein